MTVGNLAALLRAREEELLAIYENLPGILFYIAVEPGGEFRFLSVSREFLVATGLTRDQIVGSLVREVIPEPSCGMVLNHYREAIRSHQTVRWKEESVYPAGRKVGEVAVTPLYDAGGGATHLIGIVHDITGRDHLEVLRCEQEERQAFLLGLSDALRSASDPDTMLDLACRMLGEHLQGNRVVYADIEGDEFITRGSWVKDVRAKVRRGPVSVLGNTRVEALHRGEAISSNDVAADPRFTEPEREYFRELEVRAFVSIGLTKRGEWIAAFGLHSRMPRVWTSTEIELIREVAERSWSAAEQARTAEALRCVSAELQQTVDIAATGLTHCTRDLRYRWANPAYAGYIGIPLEQIIGRSIVEVIGEAAFETIRPRIERVLAGETVEYEDELPYPGGNKWMRGAYTPARDFFGNVTGWVGSVMDITDRKAAEQELAEEGRRKDEFLSLLGHELRNPLAAISTAVQLLSGGVTAEQRVSLDGMMIRQLKLMRRLLDDLLDLGRIRHGHIRLKKDRLDLAKFLQHITEVSQATTTERGQELVLRLPSEVVTFKADEARLEQVAINLLSNASKYTAQGGRIELSGGREGSEVVLRCKDNGRGIPPDMHEKIFEPFIRVEPLADRGEGSIGIGLALVKRLVELHGGTVSVESDGSGMGSEFQVRLPLESVSSDSAAVAEANPLHTSRRSRLIILVEDNSDLAEAMLMALERAQYQVRVFADGLSALERIADLNPYAVLIDIGLPGMDGYKLATELREKWRLRHTVFIGISGFRRREGAEFVDPFDYYFTKPVDLSALLTLLDASVPRAVEFTKGRRPSNKARRLRALLAVDQIEVLAVTTAILRGEGLEVRAAQSGQEALEAALQFKPQLILCDFHLPDMTGDEVIRSLRSNPITENVYAVLFMPLSSHEILEFNREAQRMGVDEFLSKPLPPDAISKLVTKLKRLRRP